MNNLIVILEKYGYQGGAIEDEDLYADLFDLFQDEMPYGTQKARTGDPYLWIEERVQELCNGVKSVSGEFFPIPIGSAVTLTVWDVHGKTIPYTPVLGKPWGIAVEADGEVYTEWWRFNVNINQIP